MSAITHSVLQADRPVLPEWTRWAWASMVEREYWKFLFDRLSGLRQHIEWLSLIEGVRPALYQHVPSNKLLEKMADAAKHGFVVTPIAQVNVKKDYSAISSAPPEPFDPNAPWEYRVLITKPEVVSRIMDTPDIASNDQVLGEILGYPQCCREFFARTWGAQQVDTTWDQYAETGNANGPVEANILWRWMGIRWVSHLPCSFQCEATVDIGRKTREAMKKHGFVEEAKIIDMILSWPVRWSGVNGIAEIVGPCIKVSTRTDWAPPTDERRFERTGRYSKPTREIWEHNGFLNYAGMIQAHAPLIAELKTLLPANGAVIDLGCGNGRLLRTVKLHRMDVSIGGVDTNAEAIKSAQGSLVGQWDASKIEELQWLLWYAPETTTLLYSPVRLTEMSPEDAARTRAAMAPYKTHVVYVYGDNLKKQPLDKWVEDSGLPVDKLMIICDENVKDVALGILRLD